MNKNQYQVILLEDPAQKVFSIRRTVGVDQYHALFQELRQEAAARGLTQAGPIQMLYHDPQFSPERSDVEAQLVVAQDGPDVSIKPPCTCAAVQHSGPYEERSLPGPAAVTPKIMAAPPRGRSRSPTGGLFRPCSRW